MNEQVPPPAGAGQIPAPQKSPQEMTREDMQDDPVEFAPGDLVVLRSGGPMLTIASIGGGHAHCIWFSAEETLQRGEIPLQCLDPADGSDLMMSGMDFEEGDFNEKDQHEEDEIYRKKKKKKKKNDD